METSSHEMTGDRRGRESATPDASTCGACQSVRMGGPRLGVQRVEATGGRRLGLDRRGQRRLPWSFASTATLRSAIASDTAAGDGVLGRDVARDRLLSRGGNRGDTAADREADGSEQGGEQHHEPRCPVGDVRQVRSCPAAAEDRPWRSH